MDKSNFFFPATSSIPPVCSEIQQATNYLKFRKSLRFSEESFSVPKLSVGLVDDGRLLLSLMLMVLTERAKG
ncbi:hypothetical protein [Sphingobacterium griseoflavum]|uniref:hypothetical protein n=1 Tax=Sphingobacterium griseoflavum TaxID=1474952 RepID=UPI001673A495|nr:hypothetical protein [Sphingobacterium griseoflavum]